MKKKIPTIILYALIIMILCIPWLSIGGKSCNVFWFILQLCIQGMDNIIIKSGITYVDATPLKVGMIIELILVIVYIAGVFCYLIKTVRGKSSGLNKLNFCISIPLLVVHMSGISLGAFSLYLIDTTMVLLLFLFTAVEIPIRILIDGWEEARRSARLYELQEKAQKEEEKERLYFAGKYTKLFYQFVWKNFGKNWKDYMLLLVSNAVVFGCIVVGLGVKQILAIENTTKGSQVFNGLERVLANAIYPIAIISVFIFILLFFYYVKCRARNFGVFLTLGMRRNMLYRFVAIEYVSMFTLAVLLGGIVGTGILSVFISNSEKYIGIAVSRDVISSGVYLKSIAILLGLSIISLMLSKEIFKDFNVGQSTDLRAIGERMPVGGRKCMMFIGILLCGLAIFRYQNLDNFESVVNLFVFFIGIFLVIRNGMAEGLIRERKDRKYLNKMLLHNQLFHKSKTNTGYIGVLVVIHFCVMFYFMFQVISANIAEDIERLFPYDVVCLADESDNALFAGLVDKYNVEISEYPAVRVSAYDATEKSEDHRSGMPLQGQHIGISESTYHKLKKIQDPEYEERSLNLDINGEYIHVVYQQDKSEHAKPTGFFSPRREPLLHIGQPCRNLQVHRVRQENVSYQFYKVKSEEIGSLIGVFHQGMKENIIVFSDEYFEKAKDLWKISHVYRGIYIEEGEGVPGKTIHQGITKLVLMNTEEKYLEDIEKELQEFEEKHLEEEKAVFKEYAKSGVYDLSVSYHYLKQAAVKNLQTERIMKITMNGLVIVIFLLMNLMLIVIKLLSEKDINQRRTEFLTCMGMRRKERIRMVRIEIVRYFYIVPVILAVLFSGIFTVCVFHARMYSLAVIKEFVSYLVPFWSGYFIVNLIVIWLLATIYAYRMEGGSDGRNN